MRWDYKCTLKESHITGDKKIFQYIMLHIVLGDRYISEENWRFFLCDFVLSTSLNLRNHFFNK